LIIHQFLAYEVSTKMIQHHSQVSGASQREAGKAVRHRHRPEWI